MDSGTFAQVRARAVRAGHSFAEEARTLIEWGLEADSAL
jgi:plasmid stability protein